MKLLLHICCAPCSIYPLSVLKEKHFDVMGFFYRHNIHPFTECLKREDTVRSYSKNIGLQMIWQKDYAVEEFIRSIAFRENNRCLLCYYNRLKATVLIAKHGKFDYFSTTLLYSKFQQHQLILETGDNLGKKYGVNFFYHDFREGWKIGIEKSKALGFYRQQYCGCIYSEKERYYRRHSTTPSIEL